jgi:hypothetical protein
MAEADGGLRVGFLQGVMLQFVNIKAWMNALMISAGWITVAEPMAPRLAWFNRTLAVVLVVTAGWMAVL